jgi:chemosensory pili system protein ChpA (sensor histidine kinase/response regulator)
LRQDSSRSRHDSARVLVVEDNTELMVVLTELLTKQGYEVLEARNGVEAMVALTAPPDECPDVVLLDVGLPLESGVSVLSFLRTVMGSGLPVVVLTGSADHEDEVAMRELGISEYLRKPAPSKQVLGAIKRALP